MQPDKHDDEKVDEALAETFPASDAPANTVETGVMRGNLPPATDDVTDNVQHSRLELTIDGQTAFLAYERTATSFTIVHTEVPAALRGRHIGERLVDAGVAAAHAARLQLVVICPFARAYLRRHPPQA